MAKSNGDDTAAQVDRTQESSAPPPPSSAHPTGPWDIVLHIVSRFPTFALTVGIVGVLFWGASFIITQSTKAQDELAEARGVIAKERGAHHDALAALTLEANTRIAAKESNAQAAIEEARKAQAAADVTVALAEAAALATVQDTLIGTSERIQALVAGQLSSMEELERVRTTTAGELNRQLEELGKRRTELEAELTRHQAEINAKNLELKLSRVNGLLDVLFETVDIEQSYHITDEAKNLAKVVDLSDGSHTNLLTKRLQERNDPTISAAVFFAFYEKTQKQVWFEQFIDAISPVSQINSNWLSEAGWQADFTPQAWGQVAGLVLDQMDESIAEQSRKSIKLEFLHGLLRFDTQRAPDRMEIPGMWRFIVANVDVLRTETKDLFGGRSFRALETLFDVAPAAAHVWMYLLSQDDSILPKDRKWLMNVINRLTDRGLSAAAPNDSLTAFWTDHTLINRKADYGTVGTSQAYESLR